jgi:hypothetical protein
MFVPSLSWEMIVYIYIYINCSKKGVSLSRDANGQLFFEVVRVLEVRKKTRGKTVFATPFCTQTDVSFYQDRLGTNII